MAKRWNNEEIDILKNNYLSKGDIELAGLLKRSTKSISSKRTIMKFIRPKEWNINRMKKENPMLNKEISKRVHNTLKIKYQTERHPNKGKRRPDLTRRNLQNNPMKKLKNKIKMVKGIIKARKEGKYNLKPTKPEKLIIDLIKENNLPFNYMGDGKIWFRGENHFFNPDFLSKNPKCIIEVYGDYWHNTLKEIKKHQERLQTYSKYGYKTLIIWEHELKNPTQVIEKINKFGDKK